MLGQENEDLREYGIVEFCVGGLSQSSGVKMIAHTVIHLVTSHTLRLDTSSCDDTVTEKRIYDPLLEHVKKFWEKEAISVSTQEETVH